MRRQEKIFSYTRHFSFVLLRGRCFLARIGHFIGAAPIKEVKQHEDVRSINLNIAIDYGKHFPRGHTLLEAKAPSRPPTVATSPFLKVGGFSAPFLPGLPRSFAVGAIEHFAVWLPGKSALLTSKPAIWLPPSPVACWVRHWAGRRYFLFSSTNMDSKSRMPRKKWTLPRRILIAPDFCAFHKALPCFASARRFCPPRQGCHLPAGTLPIRLSHSFDPKIPLR